jgi:lysophospholipase L1-like esterase
MLIAAFFLTAGIAPEKKSKPVIYLIGDSTVRNGSGKGEGGLWGWGNYLYAQFDTSKVSIRNYALGGRSSRTFISEGLWDKVLAKLKPGDYVFIQFGHNDSSPVNDNSRARGTLKGAVPVVCSLVPRNIWENGKVMRASEDMGSGQRSRLRQERHILSI